MTFHNYVTALWQSYAADKISVSYKTLKKLYFKK